jgi:hypothetical protein
VLWKWVNQCGEELQSAPHNSVNCGRRGCIPGSVLGNLGAGTKCGEAGCL